MKKFIKRYLLEMIGILVGGGLGYVYWQWVGCNSGSCAITSNPLNSTLYGALLGGLFFSIFKKDKKKSHEDVLKNNFHSNS